MMQAVVLAAGYGRRMRPYTRTEHKALMNISGTTILGRILTELETLGVTSIVIATGYLSNDIETYVQRNFPNLNVRYALNDKFAETNNIVSLALALDLTEPGRDVILIESDLILAPGLLKRVSSQEPGNLALVDVYKPGMDGTVVRVTDGLVSEVITPGRQGARFDYSDTYKTLNVYKFESDFCVRALRPLLGLYAERVDANCYYEQILGMLVDSPAGQIRAIVVGGAEWAEVDDPNDLSVARFVFEREQRPTVLDRAKGGQWNYDVIDFAYMRNVHFPTPSMIAAMRHALPAVIANYGSSQEVLNEKLSWFLECDSRHVQLLNGGSQAYPLLGRLFKHQNVLIPSPTFGEYTRLFPDASHYEDRPSSAKVAIPRRELERADVVVIVNPNNPTGNRSNTAELLETAQSRPGKIFIIDESFIEFSGQPSIISSTRNDNPSNILVLKSLSKTLGVPGLRLGYLYSSDEALIARIGDWMPIWGVNALAEYFLELLLKYRVELQQAINQTINDRELLMADLSQLAGICKVHESGGNFLLVDLHGPEVTGERLRNRLLSRYSIDVKDVSGKFPDAVARLRIGVRNSKDNAFLVQVLSEELETPTP